MAYLATNVFDADGVRTFWDFSFAGVNPDAESGTTPYLYAEDVKALELYKDIEGNAASAVRIVTIDPALPTRANIAGAPVAAGRQIKIFRQTEIRYPLVDYRDRQAVSEVDLDLANRQAIFVAQETQDVASNNMTLDKNDNYDVLDRRIVNLAPGVDPTDAVNMTQFAHTLRIPESEAGIPALGLAATRALKVLSFDAAGLPVATFPAAGSATDLEMRLAQTAGAELVGAIRGDTVAGALEDIFAAVDAMYASFDPVHLVYVPTENLVVTAANQLIDREGKTYRLRMPTPLPVTLIGSWVADEPRLVEVDSWSLRSQLANETAYVVDSAVVGYRGRAVSAHLDDLVHVTDDHGAPGGGAKGDGVTDDYAAIMAARDFAVFSGRRTLVFPRPTVSYATSGMLELAMADNFHVLGVGFPTIKYIGTAAVLAVVSLDRTVGTGRYGVRFENFNIQGSSLVQYGLYSRAISHSMLNNVRAWDCVAGGIRIVSGVCNKYSDLRTTSVGGLAGAPGLAPQEGIILDEQGVGDYVAWCTFLNTIMENVPGNGIRLNSAVGCAFIGGTSEGNTRGIFINVGCHFNRFQSIDFEVNGAGAGADMTINGHGNTVDGCNSLSFASSINYSVQAADGTVFANSNLRAVNLQTASRDTRFYICRFSDHPSLGITGSGTYNAYGCVKEDNNGLISEVIPDRVRNAAFGNASGTTTVTVTMRGSGATSATSTLLVQTNAGTELLRCRDDGLLMSPAAFATTTANPANGFIASDGTFMRSTSALKYKDVRGPIPQTMVEQVMGLSGFMYRQAGGGDGERLFVGMAADHFDVDGLRPLVSYGEDGDVEGLHYERLVVILLEEMKVLRTRVAELELKQSASEVLPAE